MKVLITGANGFIGHTLCNKMLEEEWHVRGSVRSEKCLTSLPVGIEAVQVESIGPDTDWSDALAGVNTVVHLAAKVHMVNDTVANPLDAFRLVNMDGTERLAKMAAKAGVKRFIYISSVKVNGESTGNKSRDQGKNRYQVWGCSGQGTGKREELEVRGQEDELREVFSEKDVPDPRDPYAVSKWVAEQVLNDIGENGGLEIVILRPPLVYGPDVKTNFLRLLKLVERGIPLPLVNNNNRRSLIYLGNLVDAIVACIVHPKAAGQTYLVSDGEDVSTPELIRKIAVALGCPARLFPFPLSLMHLAGKLSGKSAEVDRLVGSLCVDSSKIAHELDWRPPFTMEQGLRETTKWYLERGKEIKAATI